MLVVILLVALVWCLIAYMVGARWPVVPATPAEASTVQLEAWEPQSLVIVEEGLPMQIKGQGWALCQDRPPSETQEWCEAHPVY